MPTKRTKRFWRISPGEAGYLWREQKLHECIAIGWSRIKDIKGLDVEAVRARAHAVGWSNRDADTLHTFANDFKKGDKVIVSTSGRGVFALGTVMGGYRYDKRLEYSHTHPVRWDTTFWHPVEIKLLGLRRPLLNKFHGRSSGTFRHLSEAEWEEVTEKLAALPTPFRNLSMWGGLIQSPEYENEVIILFSQMLQHLGMRIAGFGTRFPDAIIQRKDNRGKWQRVNVEFELYSSGFQDHMPVTKEKECSTIVCWENDHWDRRKKKGLEIISLKDAMETLL